MFVSHPLRSGRPSAALAVFPSYHSLFNTRCLTWIHSNNKESFKKNVVSHLILCCHQYTSHSFYLDEVVIQPQEHISYCGCTEVLIQLCLDASLFSHWLEKVYFVSKCMLFVVHSIGLVDLLFRIEEFVEKTTISFKNSRQKSLNCITFLCKNDRKFHFSEHLIRLLAVFCL